MAGPAFIAIGRQESDASARSGTSEKNLRAAILGGLNRKTKGFRSPAPFFPPGFAFPSASVRPRVPPSADGQPSGPF